MVSVKWLKSLKQCQSSLLQGHRVLNMRISEEFLPTREIGKYQQGKKNLNCHNAFKDRMKKQNKLYPEICSL